MKPNTILELENVFKEFKDNKGKPVSVIKNLNLKIHQGECVVIVGESGCGKSTLARMISQLTGLTKGKMTYKGLDVTALNGLNKKAYYKNVQMIFQDPLSTFSPRMRIGSYLIEPYLNFKLMNKKQARHHAEKLLAMVGLDNGFMNRYPNELSGGQLQRVVIARTIGLKPDIIICDECTSALDVSIQQQIISLLGQLQDQEKFCNIFITHDLALAESFSDKIYVMYLGEIVEILQSRNISQEARHPYTILLLNAVLSVKNYNKNIKLAESPIEISESGYGCPFAPRCPSAVDLCFRKKPILESVNNRCSVACHLYQLEVSGN